MNTHHQNHIHFFKIRYNFLHIRLRINRKSYFHSAFADLIQRSFYILTSFYIGMILSVSRYAQKKQKKAVPVEAVPNGETSEYFTDGAMA